MRKIQLFFAATVCVLLSGVAAIAETGVAGSATVIRVEGVASYSLGNDQWIPLVAGKILPAGAVIRTDYNGSVDVVLGKDINLPQHAWQTRWTPENVAPAPDESVRGMVSYRPSAEQNVVRLTPNTTLAIDKLTIVDTGADTVSDTELDLRKGKVYASVKKITGASQYLIKLPNGIAGVRGTEFSIDADGKTKVYRSSGGGVVLSMVPPSGVPATTVVGAGFSFDPATGQLTINSGDEQTFLERLFTALQTIYSPVSFVTRDGTCIYVSPTHGAGGGGSPPPQANPQPNPQPNPDN
jgi:FecR protein